MPALTVNVAGHPPGPLLLVDALGIATPAGLAALCIVAGSLSAPLTFALGRALHGEEAGRVAGLLAALSPVVLLFGVSSLDYVYAGARRARGVAARGARAAVGGARWRWPWRRSRAGRCSRSARGAALVALRRDGWRRALLLAVACGVAVLALDGALAGLYGYDPISTLRRTEEVYGRSLASIRPLLVLALRLARRVGRDARGADRGGRRCGRPSRGAPTRSRARRPSSGVAVVAGFTKAETERIWLVFVPARLRGGPRR